MSCSFSRHCRASRLSTGPASSSSLLAMEALVVYSPVDFDFFDLFFGLHFLSAARDRIFGLLMIFDVGDVKL